MRSLLTVALLSFALAAHAENWIANGDFEADEPVQWATGVLDHEVTHAGRGALRVDMPAGETRHSARYGDGVEVAQSGAEPIMAAFWMRLEATKQTGAIRGGVTFHTHFREGGMMAWYGPFQIDPVASGSWVYCEARWVPRAPIARMLPSVYMQGFEGSIYVDDIYLGPVVEVPVVERRTIPISVTGVQGRFTDWPRFEVTRFEPTAHVFHFVSPEETNLTLDCAIDVTRPAPIYLTSGWGSQYWTLYSTDRHELAEIYTDERIDLSEAGALELTIPMSGAANNAGPLAPGGWVFVTDRFKSFLIYGTQQPAGEPYLDPRTGQTFAFWDSVKLDPLSRAIGANGVAAAFSLADLSSYAVEVAARRDEGGVIVTPTLRDAQGNMVPLHGLALMVGDAVAAETVGFEGAPTGEYRVAVEGDTPASVRVRGMVRLAAPTGPAEVTLDTDTPVGPPASVPAEPPRLDLIGWGSGSYAVSEAASEGPESVRRLVADAKAAGVLRLIVDGRGTAGDHYVSELSNSAPPEYDELAVAIEEGARQGVAIYAGYALGWVQQADIDLHPDWAQIRADGQPDTWYCYNNPEVRAFHGSLLAEIARKYQVAGIALDAVRPGSGCHCPICARLFAEKYGRPLAGVDFYDPDWVQFQLDSITSYVTQLGAAVRDARPDCELGGYVWSRLAPDADRGRQDWTRWLSEDLLDWVCVGNYTPSAPLFRGECRALKTLADRDLGGDTSRIFPLIGITYVQDAWPSYPLADRVLDAQLRAARIEGLTCAGYFPTFGIRTHPATSAAHARESLPQPAP